VEGDIAHQPLLVQKTRVITLPSGIKISAVCSSVSSQSSLVNCDGQTDRETDGGTDRQNYDPQDRTNIAALRGKNLMTISQTVIRL